MRKYYQNLRFTNPNQFFHGAIAHFSDRLLISGYYIPDLKLWLAVNIVHLVLPILE